MANHDCASLLSDSLVRLIASVDILLCSAGPLEAKLLLDLKIQYQKRLCQLTAELPPRREPAAQLEAAAPRQSDNG